MSFMGLSPLRRAGRERSSPRCTKALQSKVRSHQAESMRPVLRCPNEGARKAGSIARATSVQIEPEPRKQRRLYAPERVEGFFSDVCSSRLVCAWSGTYE